MKVISGHSSIIPSYFNILKFISQIIKKELVNFN